MGRSLEQYKALLVSLLPKGRAFTRDESSSIVQLMYGLAAEFERLDIRVDDLIKTEKDCLYTDELLTDFENDYGIPEANKVVASTTDGRRRQLRAKQIAVGSQHKPYYQDIASTLGYDITFQEFTPAWAGHAVAGDPCGDQRNIFYFLVQVSANGDKGAFAPDFAVAEYDLIDQNNVDYALYSVIRKFWDLIYEIDRLKPAHNHSLYDFYDRAFDRAFDWSCDNFPCNDGTILPGAFGYEFTSAFHVNYDYDGYHLVGSYDKAFNLAFDAHFGGGFTRDDFSIDFDFIS